MLIRILETTQATPEGSRCRLRTWTSCHNSGNNRKPTQFAIKYLLPKPLKLPLGQLRRNNIMSLLVWWGFFLTTLRTQPSPGCGYHLELVDCGLMVLGSNAVVCQKSRWKKSRFKTINNMETYLFNILFLFFQCLKCVPRANVNCLFPSMGNSISMFFYFTENQADIVFR